MKPEYFTVTALPGADDGVKRGAKLYEQALNAYAEAHPHLSRREIVAAVSKNISTKEE